MRSVGPVWSHWGGIGVRGSVTLYLCCHLVRVEKTGDWAKKKETKRKKEGEISRGLTRGQGGARCQQTWRLVRATRAAFATMQTSSTCPCAESFENQRVESLSKPSNFCRIFRARATRCWPMCHLQESPLIVQIEMTLRFIFISESQLGQRDLAQ